MLSYFLYNSIIITWCIQKGVNLVYMVDQTNKFQVMFQLPCSIFILINKVKKILQAFQKIEFFFVDWSITDVCQITISHGMDNWYVSNWIN